MNVFNMIARINESKTWTEHIWCKFKCKFDDRKSNSNQKQINDACQCECKNQKSIYAKKTIFGIQVHVLVKMVNILEVLLVI